MITSVMQENKSLNLCFCQAIDVIRAKVAHMVISDLRRASRQSGISPRITQNGSELMREIELK
jgi:hypothetical protein